MSQYVDGIEFVTEECCNCGILFAMTKDFQRRRLNDHKSFCCPSGHSQHYSGQTEGQKLRKQLERKQRQLEAESGRASLLEQQRNQLSKSYGKIRERVKNGVCPCCNRTFQNLLNHMRTEHPEFGSHEYLKSLRFAFGLTQQALGDEIGVPSAYISLYERDRPVPQWANTSISEWLESNASCRETIT